MTTVRIISANLLTGRASAEAFAALVAEAGADVVAVQELTARQADALAAVLPWGRLAPRRDGSGMGIALRHPGDVQRLPLGYREAYVARVNPSQWPGLQAPLEVIGAHFWAPHHPPPWRTAIRRRRQLRTLETYLDATPHPARVLVGDLNSSPMWPLYRRLRARFSDAALEIAQRRGSTPERTWSLWPGGPRLLRIDHALVTGVTVEDFRVTRIEGSDHHGIMLDVSVAAEP